MRYGIPIARSFLYIDGKPGANWDTILGSWAGFAVLYFVLRSTRILLPEKPLSLVQQQEWNLRIVGNVHAVLMLIGATITMVQAPSYSRQECYYGYQWPADIGCRVFLGFLLFEMGLQALGCQALRQLTAFLHHVGFAVLAVYCIHYSLLPLPFAWLVFGEASTIFLNFRSFLVLSGNKQSPWYKVNGIALAIVFFFARIIVYGLGLWHMWQSRDILAQHGPVSSVLIGVITVFCYGLNIMWMGYIVKGLWRAIVRKEVLHEHDKST